MRPLQGLATGLIQAIATTPDHAMVLVPLEPQAHGSKVPASPSGTSGWLAVPNPNGISNGISLPLRAR